MRVGVTVYGCASRHCCVCWDVEPPVISDIHYNHGGVLDNDFNSFLVSRYWKSGISTLLFGITIILFCRITLSNKIQDGADFRHRKNIRTNKQLLLVVVGGVGSPPTKEMISD